MFIIHCLELLPCGVLMVPVTFGVSGEGFDGSDDLGANDDDDGVWLICIGWRVIVRLSSIAMTFQSAHDID